MLTHNYVMHLLVQHYGLDYRIHFEVAIFFIREVVVLKKANPYLQWQFLYLVGLGWGCFSGGHRWTSPYQGCRNHIGYHASPLIVSRIHDTKDNSDDQYFIFESTK